MGVTEPVAPRLGATRERARLQAHERRLERTVERRPPDGCRARRCGRLRGGGGRHEQDGGHGRDDQGAHGLSVTARPAAEPPRR